MMDCQHIGLDLLVPRAGIRPDKGVFPNQIRDLLTGYCDTDDLVITEDGRVVFHRPLEREQVEGFAIDRGVIHAQHGVALAGVTPLGGGHKEAPANG